MLKYWLIKVYWQWWSSWITILSSTQLSIVVRCVCVYVCVCVCVFILFQRKGFFRLQQCLGHSWEVRINDLVLWVSYQVLLPSSFISFSKNVIFHLQRWNFSNWQTGKRTIWYVAPAKMIYIDIGYKSTSLMPASDEKILKIRKATLI